MAIANVYVEPGVFSQFKPSTALPVLPGGVRVAALVGAGRQTNLVNGEVITRGVSADGADVLANTAVALGSSIVDEDFVTYALGVDYQLGTGGNAGKVDWSLNGDASVTGTIAETYNDLVGKTFKISVNGGVEQSYTFVSGDFVITTAATAAEVATALSTNLTGISATVVTAKVKVATVAVNNASLLISNGTSNSILGFTDGALVTGPKEPAAGKNYSVDYEYAKVAADYAVRFFFNMDDIVKEHGEVNTTNTLSLGSEIVFQHGASAVALVQVNPADGAVPQQFRKAIDKLASVKGINIVVPLSTDTTLFSYISNHVNTSSALTERKERTAIVGLSGSPSVSTVMAQAQALNNKRMVLVYPPSATRFVGTNTTESTLDGSFLAAALAGIRTSTSFDVAEPLTRKEIVGFNNIPDTLLRSEKNQLGSAGVCVIETVSGIFRVRQGLTTKVTTVDSREYSVVEIIDFVGVSMRDLLEAIFIGQKILADTPSQIRSTINAVLNDLVSREIIVSFKDIQASINNIDPTQIDVQFKIAPVFPLNYILITFSLSTNS
jgi:hypothetical protein